MARQSVIGSYFKSKSADACVDRETLRSQESAPIAAGLSVAAKDNKGRRYQKSWEEGHAWLQYVAEKDYALCKVCVWALNSNRLLPKSRSVLSSGKVPWVNGFNDWRKGIDAIRKHENSVVHKESVSAKLTAETTKVTDKLITSQSSERLRTNRKALTAIFDCLIFLGRQGLAIRGHGDESSNLFQVVYLLGKHCSVVSNWMHQKSKWLGHDTVNDMLELLAKSVLRILVAEVHESRYFSIMADETSDISRKEQVSICVRFVDRCFETQEYFLGFVESSHTDAATLHQVIKSAVTAVGLDLSFCRGQAYDGAANMSGHVTGVQARFRTEYPSMVFTHCFGHQLNLTVQDSFGATSEGEKSVKALRVVVDFITSSPKRLESFKTFYSPDGKSLTLRPLCPTRWVLRLPALTCFIGQYEKILDWLEEQMNNAPDLPTRARARSFVGLLENFNVYFSLHVLQSLLQIVHPVHVAVQSPSISQGQVHQLVDSLLLLLSGKSSQDADAFFQSVVNSASRCGVGQPQPPRSTGRRGTLANSTKSPKQYYCTQYMEVFAEASRSIQRRYQSTSATLVRSIEKTLLSGTEMSVEELRPIQQAFSHDVSVDGLQLECGLFKQYATANSLKIETIGEVREVIKRDFTLRILLPNFTTLLKLYYTLPCTTCEAERSFSVLRRVKSYMRSTMTQKRLNNVCIMHVHQEALEKINVTAIIDEWIDRTAVRQNTFARSQAM